MVILSALQWKCSSLGVIALCGSVFWLCFQIPALILLQWDVTWGVHYCRYCTVEGIREIQCQKWTVGLRTIFMGFYILGISYLLFCYYICKGTHGWFGCISVAEDISELCNGFCGAAVHKLYLHRTHSRCECDIAENIKVELRAPVLTLFFLPLFQHFLNTFIICSGETNSSLMSNIIKSQECFK